LPDLAAASRLKSGIFPDPYPPIQGILTQPLKSNCLSFSIVVFEQSRIRVRSLPI